MSRTPSPKLSPRETFAMRLRDVERHRIGMAAFQRGETLSAYIRQAALDAARRDLAGAGGER